MRPLLRSVDGLPGRLRRQKGRHERHAGEDDEVGRDRPRRPAAPGQISASVQPQLDDFEDREIEQPGLDDFIYRRPADEEDTESDESVSGDEGKFATWTRELYLAAKEERALRFNFHDFQSITDTGASSPFNNR